MIRAGARFAEDQCVPTAIQIPRAIGVSAHNANIGHLKISRAIRVYFQHPNKAFNLSVCSAPGAGLFPYIVEESLVGFLEQSSRFLKPVYAGDTIYPALEVTELVPGRTTGVVTLRSTVYNQRRELVLEGMQKFLIRRRSA